MLLALAYLPIQSKYSQEHLRMHFEHIREHYATLLPGDPLPSNKLSLCLTFDKPYFDFYHSIFPLLKEFGLRALLGVPAQYILEKSSLSAGERLSVPQGLAMQEGVFEQKAPFCTWEELETMVKSGHVEVASHSYMHCNLTFPFVDIEREVIRSKELLEERLPQAISSFIPPFGKVHECVPEHYPYIFGLERGLNRSWGNKALRRVQVQSLNSPTAPFSLLNRARYTFF